MIPFFIGLLILAAIFGMVYFIRTSHIKESKTPSSLSLTSKEINPEDIVLALLTETNLENQNKYAILWNGTPGKTYSYVITHESLEIAKGDANSNSSVFKIRGIPLDQGKTYMVQVGDTKVRIPFTPPIVTSMKVEGDYLDVDTDVVPTNIEIIASSGKIPLKECQIKIEPPGFTCKLPPSGGNKPTMVIYNGPNAVNILI